MPRLSARLRGVTWLLPALVVACASSPPVRFLTLDPVAPEHRATATAGTPLRVVAVHLPALLDRQELVRETAVGELEVSDRNRWGAPLEDLVQRVLTQDLANRLAPGNVVLPDEPPPPGGRELVLDLLQFARDPSGHVIADGSWSLTRPASDLPLASEHFRLSLRAAGPDYRADARALSTLLGEIADDIAEHAGDLRGTR